MLPHRFLTVTALALCARRSSEVKILFVQLVGEQASSMQFGSVSTPAALRCWSSTVSVLVLTGDKKNARLFPLKRQRAAPAPDDCHVAYETAGSIVT